jgi:polar amino acid transport system substrate-binding protein
LLLLAVFRRLAGTCAGIALTLLAAASVPGAARAVEPEFYDRPFAQDQWEIGRRVDESQLRYCVDSRDPDSEVAAEIADAIAMALLLEPQRYVVERGMREEDITKVYGILLEHCDLYMGFKLIPGGYSEWATITRAYYDARYVFVTRDPDIGSLADLAQERPIGATLGTMAHIRLVAYNSALPRQERRPTFPMGTNDQALDALMADRIDLALVWQPSLWAREREDPAFADLRVIDPAPLPDTVVGVGALLLANQDFLRTAVDEAIAALRADGTIAAILEAHDFPAMAGP